VTTVTATVVAIDYQTRNVTLRGPEGNEVMINAPEEVRNLAQVKPGDQVVATYYRAAAIRVLAPGEATPGVGAASATERAKLGERPGAATIDAVTVTSTVEKIDRGAQQVTLRLPDGTSDVVNVRDPKNLENVKVGDLVEVAFMRAVSIEVVPPAK
jgi:Cu/Ag efflux protein CusF